MFKKQKLVVFIILFFIFILEFFVLTKLFHHSFIFADDTQIYCNSFKDLFVSPSDGLFISSILSRLFAVFLPLHLDIHPGFFKSNYFCYIESLFIILFILILNSVLFLNKKLNLLYPISFLFLSLFLFFIIRQQPYLLLFIYEGFFRMLLPSFLFVTLFYFLLKNINNKNLYVYSSIGFFIFLCCISNEFICIATVFGLLSYFGLSFRNIKAANELLYFIFYIFISILGIFILIKTGAFMRKTTNVIDIDYIYSILKQIPAFSLDYLKYIIFNHIFAYILIIIQMIILYIKSFDNKDTKETIKLILCFLFGCFVFFYMLIGLGKTHYNEGQYWLVHDDLHVMYNVILCSLNLALLNLILKYRLVKELIVGFVLLVPSIYFARSDFYFYKYLQEEKLKPWKVDIYKAEKALRLYNLYNRTAVLNIELCDNDFNWGFFEEFNEREENKFYSTSSYIIYLNQFQKEDKMAQGFIFLNKGVFESSFEQNGGIFTKEELENINFNKLMNKDFILNN